MGLRCLFGHKFVVEDRIRGDLQGSGLGGVFLLHKCARCGRRKAEIVTLYSRKPAMPEYLDAYAEWGPGRTDEKKK